SLEEFLEKYKGRRMWLSTTKGDKYYTEAEFRDEDMILFGRETAGLPRDFIDANKEWAIRIPMSADTRLRSFNLSNAANIVLFEALRQLDFPGLE
ncbi:MAG: tRNA (uridine(34)/cytosine(34)/5-carboxymethylaminomethyluridine(34)-2'-O)-methyltransferase TrmL, partial [Ruminococcus sp.]|nr:tRNA (uridine(34)/cytosine(34)/5-carboxymethylaminomethyluridine(34)-2'-O)-methyltransferase TrmL [Ruminococcus sp.]